MNPEHITSPDEALSHLFFHCCFRDGVITENEIKTVSEKLVAASLNKDLNFKDEVIRYRHYRSAITNETTYIENLVQAIRPVHALALYAVCVELCLSDGLLQAEEKTLLQHLATILGLSSDEQLVTEKLMVQRKVVASERIY